MEGVKISHLLFVDDCLLFCEATTKECKNLLDVLALYEGASGQAITTKNVGYSRVFFSCVFKKRGYS